MTGLFFDEIGRPLTPSYSINPTGRRYRYYLSRTISGGDATDTAPSRIPALLAERTVKDLCDRLGLTAEGREMPSALKRIELTERAITLQLDRDLAFKSAAGSNALMNGQLLLARWNTVLRESEELMEEGAVIRISVPLNRRRQGRYAASFPSAAQPKPDPALIAAMARAHRFKCMLLSGKAESLEAIAERTGSERTHISRTLKLAFLSPSLTEATLTGRQPDSLSLARLLDADLPLSWQAQPGLLTALANPT